RLPFIIRRQNGDGCRSLSVVFKVVSALTVFTAPFTRFPNDGESSRLSRGGESFGFFQSFDYQRAGTFHSIAFSVLISYAAVKQRGNLLELAVFVLSRSLFCEFRHEIVGVKGAVKF